MTEKGTIMKETKTDWNRINSMSDKELTQNAMSDLDNPPLDDNFFANAIPVEMPRKKCQITIRIDADVLDWFKAQSNKYQTHINAVLKAYKNAKL
jgi:uncharacterized protein (DUF4415 family)